MSQPNYKIEYDHAPQRESRGSLSSVPTPGLSSDADPTVEIRQLINQLQGAAREARERATTVERERDQLSEQLDDVRAELHQLKSREEESRAKFIEVTAVIRERDQLLEVQSQHQKSIAELQRRLDLLQRQEADLQRQRGAAVLERDSAVRDRDAIVRERDELRAKVAESQRQTLSIRQARDTAQANCHDLNERLNRLQDELAELAHERDQARADTREIPDLRSRCDSLTSERDRLRAQIAESQRELEMQRQRLLDLAEQQARLAQASSDHATALAAAREDVLKLSQERDAARMRAQEKDREIDEVRLEMQRVRTEASSGDLGSEEREALNKRIDQLNADRSNLDAEIGSLRQSAALVDARIAQMAEQVAAAQKGREEAITSLTAAQKQIEHIIRDRDQVRQQGIANTIDLEKKVQVQEEEYAKLEAKFDDTERRLRSIAQEGDRLREKAQNFEQQRLAAIDLAAQLDAAKREIRRLTADLAETRLEAHAAGVRLPKGKQPAPQAVAEISATPEPVFIPVVLDPPTLAGSLPPSEIRGDQLTEKEGKFLVAEMRRCFASFAKDPTDFSLMNELYCQVQHFSERARVSGFMAFHRLAGSLAELAQDLYKFPEQVNPSTMRTITQAIEFIASLLKQKSYSTVKDPARGSVFTVDDDQSNCEAIRLTLEKFGIRATSANDPADALAELAMSRHDLVFLDVAMPKMDGFELCRSLRSMPSYAKTPILFITGMTSPENRVQSNQCGGNDFVAKPFNLHELGLKTISHLIRSSLATE